MCDTVVVVEADRVLFAKNSDRDPNEAQLLEWHPRRRHPMGSELRCTWIAIPEVEETFAVLLSRPFWIWGAEMGANEHGVVIGNEAVFTREPVAETGLLGMDLLRLGLERAATAREAVEVMTALLAIHGQGGGAGHESKDFSYHNSFIVADPREAFVLETAARDHAVEAVRGARSISNGLTIPEFAAAHSDRIRTFVSSCRARQWRTRALAREARGPADLMRLLRDHGPAGGGPTYSWLNGALSAPCAHASGLVVATQTTASWVAELRPGALWHWVTGTAAPCTGLFKPVRVDEPLDLGPKPDDHADQESLFWRHERLHRRALRDPERLLPLFAAERDRVEAAWLAEPPEPAKAFAEADRLLAEWEARVAAAPVRDVRPAWVRRYWRVRNERSGLEL